jgi:hypothetical protein
MVAGVHIAMDPIAVFIRVLDRGIESPAAIGREYGDAFNLDRGRGYMREKLVDQWLHGRGITGQQAYADQETKEAETSTVMHGINLPKISEVVRL